jgi:hypothetical protein
MGNASIHTCELHGVSTMHQLLSKVLRFIVTSSAHAKMCASPQKCCSG